MASNKETLLIQYTAIAIRIAEPWALQHVGPAFRGDSDASESLFAALGNVNRGVFAEMMWSARVNRDSYRTFLGSAWGHDHQHVISAAGSRRRIARMFH